MKTVIPKNGLVITDSVRLEPGCYALTEGIIIEGNGIVVEASGVAIFGKDKSGVGVLLDGCLNVTISGLTLRSFYHGIKATHCKELTISNCDISDTHEIPPNTIFLDIWKSVDEAYGGAILLGDCNAIIIANNTLQHQQNGLLAYNCQKIEVHNNQCNYNSGAGIFLNSTTDSTFSENSCDYCCRFEPRKGDLHHGHQGADAAGFVAVMGSSGNKFIRNTARMSGDGFFFAGFGPTQIKAGCDNNLFLENDASWSPNIGFEATFCSGNSFVSNKARFCNYGFWCGFSTETTITENVIQSNREAGIAVENGTHFTIQNNSFQKNGHGVLLWNHPLEPLQFAWPDRDTSKFWTIENNRFEQNEIGVRIAANQSHGTRPIEMNEFAAIQPCPNNHTIRKNQFLNSGIAIQLCDTVDNTIENNRFENSIVRDIEEIKS